MSGPTSAQTRLSRREIGLTVKVDACRLCDQLDLLTLTGEMRRADLHAVEPSSTTVRIPVTGDER